jgi:hypothetical protein
MSAPGCNVLLAQHGKEIAMPRLRLGVAISGPPSFRPPLSTNFAECSHQHRHSAACKEPTTYFKTTAACLFMHLCTSVNCQGLAKMVASGFSYTAKTGPGAMPRPRQPQLPAPHVTNSRKTCAPLCIPRREPAPHSNHMQPQLAACTA